MSEEKSELIFDWLFFLSLSGLTYLTWHEYGIVFPFYVALLSAILMFANALVNTVEYLQKNPDRGYRADTEEGEK